MKPKGSLARALEAFGRVPATLQLLTYHDDPQYSRYLGLAVEHLRAQGYAVRDEDVERLSPLRFEHIHLEGRYAFTLAEAVKQGGLRPLRDPDDVLNE